MNISSMKEHGAMKKSRLWVLCSVFCLQASVTERVQ